MRPFRDDVLWFLDLAPLTASDRGCRALTSGAGSAFGAYPGTEAH